MSDQIFGILLTALGLCVVALIGLVGNIIIKRLRSKATEPEIWAQLNALTKVIYGDPTIKDPGLLRRVGDAEGRADSAERKAEALGRIIRDLSGQWTGARPMLNPNDLAELDVKYVPANHPWRT